MTAMHAAQAASPFDPANETAYQAWRKRKLAHYPQRIEDLIVTIADPYRLSEAEHQAILERCRRANMAIYVTNVGSTPDKNLVRALGAQFGLHRLDNNMCADEDSITSLQVVDSGPHPRYIPYTNRPIHWHTDGYYNELDRQIYGLLLHCVRPAMQGGENGLLDHELAYILLRDANPDYVRALMRPDAMTIPPNRLEGEELRPARSGPVFMIDPRSGHLHMRYTKRARNIEWSPDPMVQEAVRYLEHLLDSDSPYILRATLQPGWGLISNNVLHDRTGFTDDPDPANHRLLYRARYYDRIAGT